MEYYKRKTTALNVIDKLGRQGSLSHDDIAYHIELTYGFSPKFTYTALENMKKRGFLPEKQPENTKKKGKKVRK